MAFTGDPINSVTDRLRLITGDTDELDEGYSDEVYQYAYEKNSKHEVRAAIEILKMLVAKYANYVTQKAGGLFVKESERYTQYKDLLNSLTNDPRSAIIKAGVGFTGGISNTARETTLANTDVRHNKLGIALPTPKVRFPNHEWYWED